MSEALNNTHHRQNMKKREMKRFTHESDGKNSLAKSLHAYPSQTHHLTITVTSLFCCDITPSEAVKTPKH
jgi:hypothetical protein